MNPVFELVLQMKHLSEYITWAVGLIGSIAGLASSRSWGLPYKLVLIGLLAACGFTAFAHRQGKKRIAGNKSRTSVIVLTLGWLVAVGCGLYELHDGAIRFSVDDNHGFRIWAGAGPDDVLIALPTGIDHDVCDLATGQGQAVAATPVDWDGKQPSITITGFTSPQFLTMQCSSPLNTDGVSVTVNPSAIEVIPTGKYLLWQVAIVLAGVALWALNVRLL
jgi:hypothetical protein